MFLHLQTLSQNIYCLENSPLGGTSIHCKHLHIVSILHAVWPVTGNMIDYVVGIKCFIIGRCPSACYVLPKRIPRIAGINNKEVMIPTLSFMISFRVFGGVVMLSNCTLIHLPKWSC